MTNEIISNTSLLTPSRDRVINAFLDNIEPILSRISVSTEDVEISKTALATALDEAEKDVLFLEKRRNNSKGVSASKIAGAVVFRLCRAAPIHIQGSTQVENTLALEINYLVALSIGLKIFMHINIANLPPTVTKELNYTIVRRHMNQETLGLVLESVQTLLKEKEKVM